MESKALFEREETQAWIEKLSVEIIEKMLSAPEKMADTVMIGIQNKGVRVARWLQKSIAEKIHVEIPLGTLDITMYRDDLGGKKMLPEIYESDIPFDIDGKFILLVDEISHTGRTVRAALDAITYFGRPKVIRFATLIDRGQHEFPIRPDFVGKELHVSSNEWLNMELTSDDQSVIRIEKR